jgi:Flp pilus assembly protein TadB
VSVAAAATALCVVFLAAGARRSTRSRSVGHRWSFTVARAGLVGVSRRSRSSDLRLALEQMHGLLRAGWSLFGSLCRVAEQDGAWSRDARSIVEQVEGPTSVLVAIDRWAASAADPAAPVFAHAVALAGTTGASQALAIESALTVLDERTAAALELRAATAQHRASAAALVVVPVVFAGALCLLDPRVADFYLTDRLGWICVAAGLLLDGAGAWWLRRLLWSVS